MNRFETRTSNLNTQDIPGAAPKTHMRLRNLGPYDIEQQRSSQQRIGPTANGNVYSNIDYSDLNQRTFISKRQVNPLNPNYRVIGDNNQQMDLGDIPMNKPNSLKFTLRKDDMYRSMDLKTWDIRGARTDQRPIDYNFAGR